MCWLSLDLRAEGQKQPHIRNPNSDLPVHCTTFWGLRWRLKAIYNWRFYGGCQFFLLPSRSLIPKSDNHLLIWSECGANIVTNFLSWPIFDIRHNFWMTTQYMRKLGPKSEEVPKLLLGSFRRNIEKSYIAGFLYIYWHHVAKFPEIWLSDDSNLPPEK